MKRSRFILGAAASVGLGAAVACSFPDVTYKDNVSASQRDADAADVALKEDVDPNGSEAGATGLDAATLVPVDAAGCTTCDCDGDEYDRLDVDAGCDGGGVKKGVDCDDTIRAIHPDQEKYLTETTWPSKWQPAFDWDCSGKVVRQYTYDLNCAGLLICGGSGFTDNPACGEASKFSQCKSALVCVKEDVLADPIPQGCR